MYFKRILLLLLSLFSIALLKAQNVEYGVTLDTNYMLIGDQQHLTFQVKSEAGIKISFPHLQDTVVKGVEIIEGPVRDSVKERDGKWLFREKYVITAFDTGVYVIPAMPITIEASEYNNVLRTDPLAFIVNTFQVDPQKGNYDIVMPYAAPWTFREILPYLLYSLAGLGIIALLIWLWLRWRKRKPLFVPKKEEIPPYVKAITSLDEIKETKLWQAGKEKEYYTRLTDTVRQYLGDELQIPAMEQTSGETLFALKGHKQISENDRNKLANMLETADFVKFAKFTPLQDENARYLDVAYDFVNNIHQRLEETLNEQKEKERIEREKMEKKDETPATLSDNENAAD